MRVTITPSNVELSNIDKERIEQRVRIGLGRFSERVRIARVSFETTQKNGNRPKMRCIIEIELSTTLRVEAIEQNVDTTLDLALEYAVRRTDRVLRMEAGGKPGSNA